MCRKSHGRRSLAGYHPWSHELDTAQGLHHQQHRTRHRYTILSGCECTAQGYSIRSQRSEPSPPSISESSSCKTRALLIKCSLPTLPQPLAPSILLSVSVNLMTLSTLCKWDHRARLLLWTASFTECSALQVSLCCSLCQSFWGSVLRGLCPWRFAICFHAL